MNKKINQAQETQRLKEMEKLPPPVTKRKEVIALDPKANNKNIKK